MERRETTQKIKILNYVRSVRTHPTAETVYKAVKKELPSITLATVYRNLNILAEEGKILKLKINGEFRFDMETDNHQHCVCKKCGLITDCFEKSLSTKAQKTKFNNFTPTDINIIFNGFCSNCEA